MEEYLDQPPVEPSASEQLEVVEPKLPAEPTPRSTIRAAMWPLFGEMGGLDSWLTSSDTPDIVFERLSVLDEDPLSRAQFDQLLILSHEAGMSPGFFHHYWLAHGPHAYDVTRLTDFDPAWLAKEAIVSLQHLRWGLYRFFVDALLFFGNVRSAYRALRNLPEDAIRNFYSSKLVDTDALGRRGPSLPISPIARDDRYLIAEKACKSLEGGAEAKDLKTVEDAYERLRSQGGRLVVSVEDLIATVETSRQEQLRFIFEGELGEVLSSRADVDALNRRKQAQFARSRTAALQNTRLYLSMVEEMDVYVATSMRTRDDFREMGAFCDEVFSDPGLRQLEVRYFNPTLSAAQGHVDKGLIECLMVQAAKILVYYAGTKETLGKDAEFTMALSQGKPVVIYCKDAEKLVTYRDVHPLTRLIDFNTGVAVGAMVTDSAEDVKRILNRTLRNEMEYELNQTKPGYLVLNEKITGSVVRLQTSDRMLNETFWNYYQRSVH